MSAPAGRRGLLAVALLAASSCGGPRGAGPPDPTVTPPTVADGTAVTWRPQSDGVETGRLTVPLDHGEPGGPHVELFVARHRATDAARRIGVLLVNPGGPGVAGADLAILADLTFDPELVARVDIVGWDPRGTGRSTPALDCVDDPDLTFAGLADAAASAPAAVAAVSAGLAAGCVALSGSLLADVGTAATARDMDAIRRALGEDEVSYLGFSYGSELGATWATMFPATVRAAVLDGAEDPGADLLELGVHRAAATEAALDTFLAACASDRDCPFGGGGDPAADLDGLLAALAAAPLPSPPGRPLVTPGLATAAIGEALYSPGYWDQLSGALAAARVGDGSGLLALWDAHVQRGADGRWTNVSEARVAIRCMDRPGRPTPVELADAMALAGRRAPHLGASVMAELGCESFPPAADPRPPITGAGAGPIVVIGTTGDPVTPLVGSRAMASALDDGRLVVVTAAQHTGLGVNACVDDVVRAYLVDGRAPADETVCE